MVPMIVGSLERGIDAMAAGDWFALLHPVLMILFVYPVVGATIRLGILVRERRLEINPLPATVPVEHVDHGRWVTTGTVVAVLIALGWSFAVRAADPLLPPPGGTRLAGLLLVGAGTLISCGALWRVRVAALRAAFALLCWAGLLGLGAQPEILRLADDPRLAVFWRSHYWSGVLLCGLLLFTMAAKPEIQSVPAMRRLHVAAAFLIAVLLAVQAITGSRDLLAMAVGGG